jgi:hypothetical protein
LKKWPLKLNLGEVMRWQVAEQCQDVPDVTTEKVQGFSTRLSGEYGDYIEDDHDVIQSNT